MDWLVAVVVGAGGGACMEAVSGRRRHRSAPPTQTDWVQGRPETRRATRERGQNTACKGLGRNRHTAPVPALGLCEVTRLMLSQSTPVATLPRAYPAAETAALAWVCVSPSPLATLVPPLTGAEVDASDRL